jgi:hypothetical protein
VLIAVVLCIDLPAVCGYCPDYFDGRLVPKITAGQTGTEGTADLSRRLFCEPPVNR